MELIYADSAATSLHKPPQVARAVADAVCRLGNSGRGAGAPALDSGRVIFDCRRKLSALFDGDGPEQVAFTSNVTEALNTALKGLFRPGEHIITTAAEHNSVLRPLYELEDAGCELTILPCGENGVFDPAALTAALRPNTRGVVCTHASNVTGNVTDIAAVGEFCRAHGLLFILDAAQTAGTFPISMKEQHIDVVCFTGHKGLLGPQGTGGLCVRRALSIRPLKTGGSGIWSFRRSHPDAMPTALEAGTLNTPGIAGLSAGLDFIAAEGMDVLRQREQSLALEFYRRVRALPGVRVYGDFSTPDRAPIVSLNLGEVPSDQVADELQERFGIAVRAGAHCAPLIHRHFGTEGQGMVRFSFSWANTPAELDAILAALTQLITE